jgi:hypothetical protein
MTNSTEQDGFWGRWSRRKAAVRGGQSVAEAVPAEPQAPASAQTPEQRSVTHTAVVSSESPATKAPASETPPPTIQDAQKLTPHSDFKPFMARNVSPEVKNTALKKLFTDPHFNKMDMLDVYVDDYGKPDPIPQSMLRQLASAKFLKLFDEEEKPAQPVQAALGAGDDANASGPVDVAQSELPMDASPAPDPDVNPSEHSANTAQPATTHDHPDLQLQPNHAAGRPSPGPSAG